MNVAQSTQTHSKPLFLFFLPKKISEQAMLWTSLPALLLLFNIGISWLKPTAFSHYLPFLALAGLILLLCFRTLGLSLSYAIIAVAVYLMGSSSEPNEKLWQMGIFFNMALTLYIALLAVEEIEACFAQMDIQDMQTLQMRGQFQNLKSTSEERQQELEDEILRLKSEAEQRRIERAYEQNCFELIQTEMDLLNAQKNDFIEEARASKAEALATQQNLQAIQAQLATCEQKLIDWQKQEMANATENRYLADQILASQNTIMTLQQRAPAEKLIANPEETEELQKALNKSQGLYQQLRIQFQEKTEILSQVRRALFALQGELEVQELERQQSSLSPNSEEASFFENHIHVLNSEIAVMEEEIADLENMISNFFRM